MTSTNHPPQQLLNDGVRLILAAIAYYASARLGYMATIPGSAVTVWAPSGVMLGLLLLSPRRDWPVIAIGGFIGSMMSDLQSGNTLPFSLAASFANGIETLAAAALVQWRLKRPITLRNLRDLGELTITAAILSNGVTALLSTTMIHGTGPGWFRATFIWWVNDGLGMLLVTPLIIVGARAMQTVRMVKPARIVEALAIFALLAIVAESMLGPTRLGVRPGAYITFPLLLWAGLRFGPLGGAASAFLVAAIATWHAALGGGPFVDASTTGVESALQLYAYLAVAVLCGLIPACALEERAAAARAQSESESRYRAVVETATDAIVTIDGESRIQFANAEVTRIFGYSVDELLGERLTMLMPPHMAARHEAGVARYLDTGRRNIEWRAAALTGLHRDGREIPLEISFGVRIEGGRHLFTGIIRDLTEKREAERALSAAEERSRQSQKMEAIGQLAGGVAHDFNNLLTAIQGYGSMLSESLEPGSPQHEDAAEIMRAADRAASLTSQLLAFSRQQVVAPRSLNISDSVRAMEPMLRRLIGEDIELVVDGERAGQVLADPAQIEQIILNLALNARDAMPNGGILKLETRRLTAAETTASIPPDLRDCAHVMLIVTDNGSGMDAMTQARLFEPFFTTKPVGKGTGLGLATVYGIVQQSGGSIRVDSEMGRGSTFTIYLPEVDMPAAESPNDAAPRKLGAAETVLLLEDDDVLRKMTSRILEKEGYNVVSAGTPGRALELADRHGGAFDLLLSDVVLPEMSGREFAERLRSKFPHVKVVYMSGYTQDAVMQRGVLEGETVFVQKPFTQAGLLRTIRETLDMHRAQPD